MHIARGNPGQEPDPQRVYDRNISLVHLSAVCRHWRFTAIGDGTLWSNISFSPSILSTIDCALNFLKRSRGAPLTLAIWSTGGPSAVIHSPAFTGLMGALREATERITAVHTVNPPDVVVRALSLPAANLGHLSIHTDEYQEISPFFDGIMPQLRYLSISNPTGWEIKSFQHLQTIHITANTWRRWRLSALLDCLDANVALRELHLTCFESFEPEPPSSAGRIVSLASLHLLRLTFCNSVLLLDHLDIPPCTALSIYSYCQPSENIFACLPDSSRFLGVLKSPQFLTVVFDVEKGVFEVEILGPGDIHILLGAVPREGRFERKWVLRSMTTVTRFAPLSGIKWLTMVIDERQMPWKSWLSRFNQLSALEVQCPDPEEILNALVASIGETGRVLCPLLRSLSMERSKRPTINSSLLRECLAIRASTGNAISRLNLGNLDWSSASGADLVAWEELISRTQLDGRYYCLHAPFWVFTSFSPSHCRKFYTTGGLAALVSMPPPPTDAIHSIV